jgi:hypothetical protein
MSDTDLRNADLSELDVRDMTAEQRAELRRRYVDFVQRVGRRPTKAAAPAPKSRGARAWVPGKRPS